MTRQHGHPTCGEHLAAKVPHGHWNTMSFVGGRRRGGIIAPLVLDGPINVMLFYAWVDQFLVPALRPSDVVVLDNLGSHKVQGVPRAIRAIGAHSVFLPPSSPDLNPIEIVFAKLKMLLRQADERFIAAALERISKLLECFTPEEWERMALAKQTPNRPP